MAHAVERGFVGEGHDQQVIGADQVRRAPADHLGFAGAWSSDDQQGAATVEDCFALRVRQPVRQDCAGRSFRFASFEDIPRFRNWVCLVMPMATAVRPCPDILIVPQHRARFGGSVLKQAR
jgi:hypothetical protein